jgi:4-coumarate--CoA ligase (photoactive yellow protein activation family)
MPKMLGVPVTNLDALSLVTLSALLRSGDVVVGFPLLWKKCGELGTAYPAGITGVTSTGPCPVDVIERALAGGLSRMAEIHGSTETGGLGYRFSHRAPYRLMDHWFAPGDDGTLARMSPSGGAPAGFALPDEMAWEGERLYRPTGRKDKAVQVGGVNVYPERVRRVLLDHPLVVDASVRPMAPGEGDRLKAFIVVRDIKLTEHIFIRKLREYLAGILTPSEMPKNFTLGLELPRNQMGKSIDWNTSTNEETL